MLTPRDYRLLDAAEGYPSAARRERAAARPAPLPRDVARVVELEMERGALAYERETAAVLDSFRAVLSAVALTGDAFDDRNALDRAAYAHARTIRGWYPHVLEDLADEAVASVLRAASQRRVA